MRVNYLYCVSVANMKTRIIKRVFLSAVLIWMFDGVFSQKRPPFKELEKDHSPDHVPVDKICTQCTDLYQAANRDYKKSKNQRQFCVSVLQIERCIDKLRRDHQHCFDVSLLSLKSGLNIHRTRRNCSQIDVSLDDIPTTKPSIQSRQRCKYKPSRETMPLTHCGMFGDPHLRTFRDQRQTCAVAGAWPLLDNEYLGIQVTNEVLQTTKTRPATATSKVTVMFKDKGNHECFQQKIYEANSNHIPDHFKDGTSMMGLKGCWTTIYKFTDSNGNDGVELYSCQINTTIIIRKVEKWLTFNMKMPDEFVEPSYGLCVSGCPVSEMVDLDTNFFKNKFNEVPNESSETSKMSLEDAIIECEQANLTDFYYDSCVFDLMTTGNRIFSSSAILAMLDAKSMDPKLRLRRENSAALRAVNNVDFNEARGSSSSSKRTSIYFWTYIYCLMAVLFLFICR